MDRTPNVAFSERPTGARTGKKFFIRMRTPAASMWLSIPTIPIFCSPHCGRGAAPPRIWPAAGRGAGGPVLQTDGGATWKRLEEHGLPKGPYGRIGIAVAANSDRIYALIEAHNPDGGLYRSDDGGETWDFV